MSTNASAVVDFGVRAVVAPVDPSGLTIAGHVSVWEKDASTGRDRSQVGIVRFFYFVFVFLFYFFFVFRFHQFIS